LFSYGCRGKTAVWHKVRAEINRFRFSGRVCIVGSHIPNRVFSIVSAYDDVLAGIKAGDDLCTIAQNMNKPLDFVNTIAKELERMQLVDTYNMAPTASDCSACFLSRVCTVSATRSHRLTRA
jgi:chromosome condensin MukBEF MukE localization factor